MTTDLQNSIDYLNSPEALRALEADPYWPKWNSPWWHMLLLHEMGETLKIPEVAIKAYVVALNHLPVKNFPFHNHELPKGVDLYRFIPCHCQLGNAYQVLAAWGVDVDKELPWIRPWFLKYQMADGGLNCDNEAYLVKDEVPSSMVGTIAAFEAILLYTPREWTKEEKLFLEKGARFLMDRKLMLGSSTKHNAEEKEDEAHWLQLCFPRYYLYDVLRGLTALLTWSEKTGKPIPKESIEGVVKFLKTQFPNGKVKIGRHSYEDIRTILQDESGTWLTRQSATFFPLLKSASEIGSISPYLSAQWAKALESISKSPFV